jgi:hypothetical protein
MKFEDIIANSSQNLSGQHYSEFLKHVPMTIVGVPGSPAGERYRQECVATNNDPLMLVKAVIVEDIGDPSSVNEYTKDSPVGKRKCEAKMRLDENGCMNLSHLLKKASQAFHPPTREVTFPIKDFTITAKSMNVIFYRIR